MFKLRFVLLIGILTSFSAALAETSPDAKQIIKDAIDHFRGLTSYSEATMVIHRPDWERSMDMKVWTEGMDKSLVRVTAPKKDIGNGSLLIGDDMWSYTPKINRVIKIPSSMANQSWMGSDFTNNDVARADDLIEKYTHKLIETRTENGMKIHVVESIPHEDAPVVWGKEVITVREDHILLEHLFYDQDGVLVKKMSTHEIKFMSGRNVATIERMQKVDVVDEWTEFRVSNVEFGITIDKNTFTLSNLRNPRF